MPQDTRYASVKASLEKGVYTELSEILDVIPKSTLRRDIRIGSKRMATLVEDIEAITMSEIFRLSDLFDVDYLIIVKLIHKQHCTRKGKKSDKPLKTK